MNASSELVAVGRGDLMVGHRIPYDIYNTSGQLLVAKDQIVNEHDRILILLNEGRRLRPLTETAAPMPPIDIRRPDTQRPPLPDAKVLVAEDMKLSQMLLVNMLNQRHIFNIDTVDNGEQAVERFHLVPYHAVFLDIDMPVLDGLTALARIKAAEPGVFACLVSANSTRVNVHRARELGANGFLVKPLSALNVDRVLNLYNQGK